MGLNKTQLIAEVAKDSGMTKVDAEKVIKSVFNQISGELAKGGGVQLIGFGTFSVVAKKERMGKNPRTGASIKIPAKKVAKFKPGKQLKDMVDVPEKKVGKKKGKK